MLSPHGRGDTLTASAFFQQLVSSASDRSVLSTEYRVRTKDGKWEWVQTRGSVLSRTDKGDPEQLIFTLTVTIERRQSEEALKTHAWQQAIVADLGQRALAGADLAPLMDDACALVAQMLNAQALTPDSDWFEFLESVASQAASAIDNTRLFDSLQCSNIELAVGKQFNPAVSQAFLSLVADE